MSVDYQYRNGQFKTSPYIPDHFTMTAPLYTANYDNAHAAGVTPYTFTGWRDEEMSWYDTCYIHGGLNPANTYRFWGPDALKFCDRYFTNSFKNFPIGKSKHGLMVDEDGTLMSDGMLLRTGEDEFLTYWLNPYLGHCVETCGMDVQGEELTTKVFMYQLGGPKSLEIVEAATGEDFHDLGFTWHRPAKIDGCDVNILRIGMAGALAYEVHGKLDDAERVYDKLCAVGAVYGIKKLGRQAYWNTHTENGFPQYTIHFFYGWEKDPTMPLNIRAGSMCRQTGSYDPDIKARYVNPYELGWGFCVNLKHDFIGRDACERIKNSPHREMRTLVWDMDDILDIYRSEFEDEEPYFPIEGPEDAPKTDDIWDYRQDQVLVGDTCVGVSSGRCFSWKYRDMISLGIVEPEYAELGTEVEILWGDPGTRQKKIRATVARYPYYNEKFDNKKYDVDDIPRMDFDALKATPVAGTYAITAKTPFGTQPGTFEYQVEGGRLTGKATVMGVTMDIEPGTVDANEYEHGLKVAMPGMGMDLAVRGEVMGDSICGTMKGGVVSMTFVGKRQ